MVRRYPSVIPASSIRRTVSGNSSMAPPRSASGTRSCSGRTSPPPPRGTYVRHSDPVQTILRPSPRELEGTIRDAWSEGSNLLPRGLCSLGGQSTLRVARLAEVELLSLPSLVELEVPVRS